MSSYDQAPDPDDMFSETRMTFGEHIEDLRTHLIRAIVGFCVAMVAAFFIAKPVLEFIDRPVKRQLSEYWERFTLKQHQQMADEIANGRQPKLPPIRMPLAVDEAEFKAAVERVLGKVKEPELDLMPGIADVLRKLGMDGDGLEADGGKLIVFQNAQIPDPMGMAVEIQRLNQKLRPPGLTTLSVQEAFVVFFKVALMTGFVLGSPWIFYQIWMFIAAGLYPHEKKYVNIFLPFSLGLFLGGVFICEFFVMDRAIEALLWFNEWLGFSPDLRLNEWLGFAILMPLVFGISFQTPLVMLFLQRVGILRVEGFRRVRRIAWFLLAVFAAVISPSVDPVSMMFLWIPLVLLYELGIFLCVYLPGKPLLDFEPSESEELVEV